MRIAVGRSYALAERGKICNSPNLRAGGARQEDNAIVKHSDNP